MNDFFKQFRENWENRLEPVFQEQDWKALENRLDQQLEKPARSFLLLWALLPLLLLLLGTNIWSLIELRKANQKITAFEVQKDTIYQRHVTIQIDTVYQTRIIKEPVLYYTNGRPPGSKYSFSFPSPHPNHLKRENLHAIFKKWSALPPNLLSSMRSTKGAALEIFDSTLINTEHTFDSELAYLSQRPPGFLTYKRPDFPYEPPLVTSRKKTIKQYVYAMRPKGFQLGFGGGWVRPFDQIDHVNSIAGYTLGLQGSIEFSDNLRLWVDAAFSETKYEASRMEEVLGVTPIDPPSDEFTFFKAEVPQSSLNYAFGMDYQFDLKGNFKPFIGAGYGAAILLPDETSYEFRNDPLDIVVTLDHANLGRMTYSDLYLLRTGLDYSFSKQWDWKIWGTYRAKWGKNSVHVPTVFSMQTGLLYRF